MTRPVLFDTDPGCDDAVALALALASDELDVVGVTTVAGNTTVDNATHNALAVLELLDRTDVPVASGCPAPLCRDLETAEHVHSASGITGGLPEPRMNAVDTSAVEFILEAVRMHGKDLTIAAVGPLTNLAAAIAIEPDLADRVGAVYFMGGAALCPGNRSPEAEFNAYVDPEAARRVVQDAAPRVVGLDVTNDATLSAAYIERLARRDDLHRTLAAWMGYTDVDTILAGELDAEQAVHDATVIVDLVADVLEYRKYPLDVCTEDGLCRGATVCDVNGVTGQSPNARVALTVDVDAYRDCIIELVERL